MSPRSLIENGTNGSEYDLPTTEDVAMFTASIGQFLSGLLEIFIEKGNEAVGIFGRIFTALAFALDVYKTMEECAGDNQSKAIFATLIIYAYLFLLAGTVAAIASLILAPVLALIAGTLVMMLVAAALLNSMRTNMCET